MVDDDLSGRLFRTRDSMDTVLQTWAAAHGFQLCVRTSMKDRYVCYSCARGGKLRLVEKLPKEDGGRDTNTQKCGCRFRISASKKSKKPWVGIIARASSPSGALSLGSRLARLRRDTVVHGRCCVLECQF